MIKGKVYHTMTDSNAREKEAWFADIPDQVAAFRKRGGSSTRHRSGRLLRSTHKHL